MKRLCLTLMLLLSACVEAPDDRPSLIEGPRVLAVRGEPPEVSPGQQARFEALVVGVDGRIVEAAEWAFCTTPKPPTENNVVDPACLAEGSTPFASGVVAMATIPTDACKLFGPEPPGPGLRARDADITGGYYQPVRIQIAGQTAFGLERIRCNLAQAPLRVAQAFREGYTENQNPTLGEIEVSGQVSRGARVGLSAAVEGAETYLRFDAVNQSLEEAEEALTVSWFATAGRLEVERDTVSGDRAETVWVAPDEAGPAHLYAVLRDSRGGVAFVELSVEVP